MKPLLAILCCALIACGAPVVPPEPPPIPPPAPPAPVVASYIITEFGINGRVARTWTVTTYREVIFPPSVTFMHDGQTITLKRSYQIDRLLK